MAFLVSVVSQRVWQPVTSTSCAASDVDANAYICRLLEQDLPPEEFRRRYYEYLRSIRGRVSDWLSNLSDNERTILCCWCTPERQQGHPRLFCHRILVSHVVEVYRPDLSLFYEDGAENPVWLDNKAAGLLDGVTHPLI